jgi:hypothetical protein
MMNQLKNRILSMLEAGSIKDLIEKKPLIPFSYDIGPSFQSLSSFSFANG